jgi:diguanylate cyclase (GGDEF)-like protein
LNSDSPANLHTEQRVYHERVRYLYQGGLRAIIFNITNSALLLGVYWFQLPISPLIIWFSTLTFLSVARIAHIAMTLRREWDTSSDRNKLQTFQVGVFLTATTWGVGFTLLSPALNDTYTLLFLFTLAGMVSGAFTSMASDRQTYLLYVLPIMIPAMLTTVSQANLLSYVMTFMLILFTIMLAVSHKLAAKTFADGFLHRFEHEELIKELVVTNNALTTTNTELERTKEDLRELSLSDELTGIPNRRYFSQILKHEIDRARRDKTPLSAIMIDVDAFKKYNDTYGHAKGDQCLRHVAELLKNALHRSTDFLARYGGEEFVVLLPNTDPTNAKFVAERLRLTIYDSDLPHTSSPTGRVTVSAGIACCSDTDGWERCQTLIELADNCLYLAKQQGRNRVVTKE